MLDKEFQNDGFMYPNTLGGRSVLFLFTAPFILLGIRFVCLFFKTAINAFYNVFISTQIVEKAIEPANPNIILLYIKGLINLIMYFTFLYFDILLTLSIILFFVFMFFRFKRNGLISKNDWLKITIITSFLFVTFPIRPILYEIYENTFTLDAILNFDFIESVIRCIFYFIAMVILSNFIFIKAPHAIESQFKTAPKDFLSHNLSWLLKKIRYTNLIYIVIVSLMAVGYLFLMGF